MSPTASGVSRPKARATAQPRNGMIRYWAAKPMAMARGIARTRLKSATLSVTPMPSMITDSPQTIDWPRNQVNSFGSTKASPPPVSTQTGNRLVNRFSRRLMRRAGFVSAAREFVNKEGALTLLLRQAPAQENPLLNSVKDQPIQQQPEEDRQDHDADHLRRIVQLPPHIQEVAEPDAGFDQLGGNAPMPRQRPTQFQSRHNTRQGRRQNDPRRHGVARRPQGAGHPQINRRDVQNPIRGRNGNGGQWTHDDDEENPAVAQPKEQQRNRDPGRRGERLQSQGEGSKTAIGHAAHAHEQADHQAEQRRDGKPDAHPPKGGAQTRPEIIVRRQFPEALGHLFGRRKQIIGNELGGKERLPDGHEQQVKREHVVLDAIFRYFHWPAAPVPS